jgi:hypothetical protein
VRFIGLRPDGKCKKKFKTPYVATRYDYMPGVSSRSLKDKQVQTDLRKQLFNDGLIGPIEKIQVPTECITQLNGILFDLDPKNYFSGALLEEFSEAPKAFYMQVARQWLARHPVLEKAEVRNSGTGVHGILWLNQPVKFENTGDRERWAGIIEVVQAALPVDPDQPGITATTRRLSSINSKNGARVCLFKKPHPVSVEEVLGLYGQMCEAPFKTVMQILIGKDRITPCPVCGDENTELVAGNYVGNCYGSCGKVRLQQLYDLVLASRERPEKGCRHAKAK